MRLLGARGQQLGPGLGEQPLLVPEVLDPFAQLVHALVAALGARPPAAPRGLPGSNGRAPARAAPRSRARASTPGFGPRPRRSPRSPRRRAHRRRRRPRPAPGRPRAPPPRRAPRSAGRRRRSARAARSSVCQLDLGVAALRKQPAGVAEAAVLGPVGLLAERLADQAQHGAGLLQVFARAVDRLRRIPPPPAARSRSRARSRPAQRDPAHALGRALVCASGGSSRSPLARPFFRRAGRGRPAVARLWFEYRASAGQLLAEPGRRLEAGALRGGVELDLDHPQALQAPL